ncbi:hypothetical protein HDU80_003381 [Chytriomyces hyalinus]|nr:hypothetical protein HDU80_003381 [Chytriomyces hyalinus]
MVHKSSMDESRTEWVRKLRDAFPRPPPRKSARPTSTPNIVSANGAVAVLNDSPSLWNTSLNQGWTKAEEDILCSAILRYGVGNWRAILDSGCLPGKNPSQMYLQTQRILGQQSISEFTGLHVDCRAIGEFNRGRVDVVRKNRLINNQGGRPSKEELQRKVKENKEKYEVPKHEWLSVILPRRDCVSKLIEEKKLYLSLLETEMAQVKERIRAIHSKKK